MFNYNRVQRKVLGTMLCLAATMSCIRPARAATISLGEFELLRSISSLPVAGGTSPNDFSGVTYSPVTDTLFMVDNKSENVYEYTTRGEYQRTIAGSGFVDLEGIVWMAGDTFAVLEERNTDISIVTIDEGTTALAKSAASITTITPTLDPGSLNPPGLNFGLEGISYDAAADVFYVAKEKSSGASGDLSLGIYQVEMDGSAQLLFDPAIARGGSSDALSDVVTDLAGMHFDNASGDLFLVSEESNLIVRTTLAGEVLDTRVQPGTQIEGLTFTPDGRSMFVVGEPREYRQYATGLETVTLVSDGSTWSYLDDGSNPAAAWRQDVVGFDGSGWGSGPAQLGYGDGDEATVVSYGPSSGNKFITTYFRRPFEIDDASRFEVLQLELLRDDGAVVYLNGQELLRDNMPGGNVTYTTLATTAVGGGAESTFYNFDLDPALLIDGTNLLAVEIHQASATSSDISFDAILSAVAFENGPSEVIPEPAGFLVWMGLMGIAAIHARWRWRWLRRA